MRITLGGNITVSTLDRWYAEIRAGRAFTRGVLLGASVGNFGEVQLMNPAASGVNALVHRAVHEQATDGLHELRFHNVALATDVGAGYNLLAGGAAAACHIRTATPAAADGALLHTMRTLARVPFEVAKDWLIELGQGEGILIVSDSVNVSASCFYDWVEVPA